MTRCIVLLAMAGAVLIGATAARAQDDRDRTSAFKAEITPYVFLGSNTANGVGAAVRWPLVSHLSVELETNYRRAEIGALSSNVSMLFDFPRVKNVTPYVAAGIGLDQYGAPAVRPDGVATHERTGVSVNAGGGIRVQADDNWGIRTDVRWFNTLGKSGPERWRLYNGVTYRTGAR